MKESLDKYFPYFLAMAIAVNLPEVCMEIMDQDNYKGTIIMEWKTNANYLLQFYAPDTTAILQYGSSY